LPLYAALGAAGGNARAERLHASSTYGVLRMDVYAFQAPGDLIRNERNEVIGLKDGIIQNN
jgi:4,5-DOPA dioxygenase extradiol